MSMVSRFIGSDLVEVSSSWSGFGASGAALAGTSSGCAVVPRTKLSASGPSMEVGGVSGRLNLLFASAICEPHKLVDQVPNLLGCLFVALLGRLHLRDGETVTGRRGVALPLLNLRLEDGEFLLGKGLGDFAAEEG